MAPEKQECMLLVRLTENHARLKQLPEKFREQLLQDNGVAKVPSELVTMLMETGGDLQALFAQFMAKQEQENELRHSQKTEQQVVAIYGPDVSKCVIAAKKASGMVVPLAAPPCRFYPQLRLLDGGPPPLRSNR